MNQHGLVEGVADATPLVPLQADGLEAWLADQPAETQAWVAATGLSLIHI